MHLLRSLQAHRQFMVANRVRGSAVSLGVYPYIAGSCPLLKLCLGSFVGSILHEQCHLSMPSHVSNRVLLSRIQYAVGLFWPVCLLYPCSRVEGVTSFSFRLSPKGHTGVLMTSGVHGASILVSIFSWSLQGIFNLVAHRQPCFSNEC